MEMRPFGKTDFYAFAGAQGWDGHAPFFGEGQLADGMRYVLVLDRNGGCLVLDDDQAQFGGYVLDRKFHNAEAASAFAEHLGKPLTRYDFFVLGFKTV